MNTNLTDHYFNREHFEHWLDQQPNDRKWSFFSHCGCVVNTFLLEFHGCTRSLSGDVYSYVDGMSVMVRWPKWLVDTIPRLDQVLASDLKAALGLPLTSEPTLEVLGEQQKEKAV